MTEIELLVICACSVRCCTVGCYCNHPHCRASDTLCSEVVFALYKQICERKRLMNSTFVCETLQHAV